MNEKYFLNNDVVRITGATPRQVLGWTEKGLIVPYKETLGAGSKRIYDYVNVLEICLCRDLFSMGIGVQSIKKILNELRRRGLIKEWAQDFNKYYTDIVQQQKERIQPLINEAKESVNEQRYKFLKEFYDNFLKQPYIPERPLGILMIFYSKDGEEMYIIPWGIDYVLALDKVKNDLERGMNVIMIDIGQLKSKVDSKIK